MREDGIFFLPALSKGNYNFSEELRSPRTNSELSPVQTRRTDKLMSSQSSLKEKMEALKSLQDQIGYIIEKRSVRIKIADFPPSIQFSTICETLASFLRKQVPIIDLEHIAVSDNGLKFLPYEFQTLCGSNLKSLDLHNNQLSSLPTWLSLRCSDLEILDLSHNLISVIPSSSFSGFKKIKYLSLKANKLSYIPPILGEITSLESLIVRGNMLMMPSNEMMSSMEGGISDLKSYLVSNSSVIEKHIDNQLQGSQKSNAPMTPSIARTRSLSDTRSKSSKASRRMGLIINSNKATPESFSYTSGTDSTPSKPQRKLSLPATEKSDFSAFVEQKGHLLTTDFAPVTSTYTASTASNSLSFSPPNLSQSSSDLTASSSESQTKEADQFSTASEQQDADSKSGNFSRRLSTLEERPTDEYVKNNASKESRGLEEPSRNLHRIKENSSPVKHEKKRNQVMNLQQPLNNIRNTSLDKGVIMIVSRKILFSFSELHSSIKRLTGLCSDKKVSSKIIGLIQISKENIESLSRTLEVVEAEKESQHSILSLLHSCISSLKSILNTFNDYLSPLMSKLDVCHIRMVLLTLYGSLNELNNANKVLVAPTGSFKHPTQVRNPSISDQKTKPLYYGSLEENSLDSPSIPTAAEAVASLGEIDERLYQSIDLATENAHVVFGELTKAISKSAIATANTKGAQATSAAVTLKFRELTHVCMTSMEITKRLMNKLSTIRTNQDSISRRLFWDDINLFLKSIIQTFSSVKDIMRDAPIFNEVRGSMANLTKTTKELTIVLEASSYKSMSDSSSPPTHLGGGRSVAGAIQNPTGPPSVNNGAQLQGYLSTVRTPLVATVGTTVAQAILAQQDSQYPNVGPGSANISTPSINIPPSVASDVLNSGLHTAPVQSMEQFYAKNVNPFDRI